jgi:hypothetical protein
MPESFCPAIIKQDEFASPNGPILPIACAVPGYPKDTIRGLTVLEQHGENMGKVVLHGHAGQPCTAGINGGSIIRMLVAGHGSKPGRTELPECINCPGEHPVGCGAPQVPYVRAQNDAITESHGYRILHLGADAKQRLREHAGERERGRSVPPCPAKDDRRP